jgi:hypothetical protein
MCPPKTQVDTIILTRRWPSKMTSPAAYLCAQVSVEHLPTILDAVERALAPLTAADGHLSPNGSTWIESATNPG